LLDRRSIIVGDTIPACLLAEFDLAAWVGSPLGITLLLVVGILLLCWLFPYYCVRVFLWVTTHTLYRVRVLGLENVPATGGALLVCNHVSYIDWLILMAAQRRYIRFVVFKAFARALGIRHLMRWAGVIPIDGSGGPRGIVKSLREASEALARGELVCIFAEGRLTRTGLLLPFARGFEQIVKNVKAPIIPVCLDQVWGSVFSMYGGHIFWKMPQELPYHVTVAFGKPLPPETRAADVRQAVQKLSADCAIARTPRRKPVHRRFVRVAAQHPFRTCIIDSSNKGQELTYGKTLAGAMCLANALRPILGDEKMVGVWLPPGTGAALTNIAISLMGKTSVNLNYSATAEVVQAGLKQCEAKHVITARRFDSRVKLDPGPGVEPVYLEDVMPKITSGQKLRAFLKVLLLPRWWLDRVTLGLGGHTVNDLATIIFSSGSTGEPKGVMLTHGNIAANAESMIQAAGLTKADRLLCVLPFFHSFGYTVTLWTPLQIGASSVYHADPRAAREIGELCRTHTCTIFLTTPTFLRFCLKKCEENDFRTVRILITGAEKLPPALAADFEKRFGVLPHEGYGCTELSPVAAACLPDKEVDGYKQICNRAGTVGQPLPGIAARTVDPDKMETLPVGEEGLLLIFGANVMQGYLGKPEMTAKVVIDGWYVTGDMAKIDDNGFVTLTGRLSRFAKVGGEMVPLERIEEELHDALQTSERVGVVTCVPDEARGERLVVLYVAQPGLEVSAWLKKMSGRGLPNLWIPAERDFYTVPELPILGSGKVNLKQVKDMALGLAKR
jgi:acyl-[acyl-carrier-protein]-phospholipid O-acyltransferase/long-chain-fatty-acid--[acyl-carrier-protein] ligase